MLLRRFVQALLGLGDAVLGLLDLPDFVLRRGGGILLVVVTVLLSYEVLRLTTNHLADLPIPPRARIIPVVIACFSDPGVDAAREATTLPVVGIQEAAMHLAAQLGHRFSVLTTLARRAPVRERAALLHGLDRRLASCVPLHLGSNGSPVLILGAPRSLITRYGDMSI